ncbi:MAG: lysophospholipase [Bacilli bacterium]|nr:lysophospholipase [Bacilli bacterium]
MPIWLIILLSVLGGLLILASLPLIIVEVGYKKMFPHRADGVNSIRYFHKDEFNGLMYEKIYFLSKKDQLKGYIYKNKKCKSFKACIIMCHGIGFGHAYYLPLINKLCEDNYIVMAFDQYASGISEGLKVEGMARGVVDLDAAINFASKHEELGKNPLYVLGHSWGGYSALAVLAVNNKPLKVISLAGFNSEVDLYNGYVKGIKFLKPYFYLHNKIKYGKLGNLSGVDGLKVTDAKVLYLQGENDLVVPPAISSDLFKEVKKDNISIEMLPHKGHSFFFSFNSEENQGKLLAKYGLLGGVDKDYNNFVDYRKMSELDPDIYSKIVSFFDN